jgi:hypothetical protein
MKPEGSGTSKKLVSGTEKALKNAIDDFAGQNIHFIRDVASTAILR